MLKEAGLPAPPRPQGIWWSPTPTTASIPYLRPRDIAVYVGSGTVDAGITGRDLLLDAGSGAEGGDGARLRRVNLPVCRLNPGEIADVAAISSRRVATSYPGLVAMGISRRPACRRTSSG